MPGSKDFIAFSYIGLCFIIFFNVLLSQLFINGKRGIGDYWSLGKQVSGQPLKCIDLLSFQFFMLLQEY